MALLNKGKLAFAGSPEDLVKEAEGNVWQIQATEAEYLEINEKYPVISTIPIDGVITSYSIHYTKLYEYMLDSSSNVI